MRPRFVQAWLDPLRHRWPALLAVAGLTLGPAVATTSLVEVLETRSGAIINGSIVSYHEIAPWTRLVLSVTGGPAPVRVSIPLLVVLAWFIGLGTALRVLAGRSVRTAWHRVRPARLLEWCALGVLLAGVALLGLPASVAVAGRLGVPLGGLTAGLWAYGLVRLALALPAMLVDGRHLPTALRRVVVTPRGHAPTGALALVTVGLPALVLTLLDPESMPAGRTWVGDVLWSAVVPLVEYLVLVAVLPLQAAGLLGVYRVAGPPAPTPSTDVHDSLGDHDSPDDPWSSPLDRREPRGPGRPGESPTDDLELTVTVHDVGTPLAAAYGPTSRLGAVPLWAAEVLTPRRGKPAAEPEAAAPALSRASPWRRIAVVVLLGVGPVALGPALLLLNPNGLPVMAVARPEAGFSGRPLAMAVLDDGTVVSVGLTQAARCRDAHCTDLDVLRIPCVGGAPPAPDEAAPPGCPAEGPIRAADVTPDGTVLALVHGPDREVRLVWCRVGSTEEDRCRWGGATTIYREPDQWWDRSMSVTGLPGGGFAAVIIAAGLGETRATARLVTCGHLDCPQPTVHIIPSVPRPSQVGGLVDVSADPASGSLAVGYIDRSDEMLYLGGCPAGCPDGPAVARIGRWRELTRAPLPDRPVLQVLATASGAAAALGAVVVEPSSPVTPDAVPDDLGVFAAPGALEAFATPGNAVVTCGDPGCITFRRSLRRYGTGTLTLVANPAGEAYVVASLPDRAIVAPLRDDYWTALPITLDAVVAAALGPDGRLRLVTQDDQGPALITLY